MALNVKLPNTSNQLFEKDISNCLNDNYKDFSKDWMNHQLKYMNSMYFAFKDHYKFIIIIYLVNKKLLFYTKNFIKLNYEEFFLKESVEIEKISVIEISKSLSIPKETARRKIKELENSGIIKRRKKILIINRQTFDFIKPANALTKMSQFISKFTNVLSQDGILKKKN
jgi:hypothetical protein